MSTALQPDAPILAVAVRPRAVDFLALAKPRITVNVVFTTLGGLLLAPGSPSWAKILTVLLGTVFVVGGANALNMYLERDSDGLMRRTKSRPLPAGRLQPTTVLWFGIALGSLALPILAIGANLLTAALAATALASYVLVYTPMKRRSPAALFVGAVPGAIPPLMGWTAATGRLDLTGAVLFLVMFIWQIAHFLAIAIYLSDDFARGGIKVMPLVSGTAVTKRYIVGFAALLLPASALLVPLGVGGVAYLVVALTLGCVFLGYSLLGFRATDERAWGRSLFIVSLFYMTGLFITLAVQGRIHAG